MQQSPPDPFKTCAKFSLFNKKEEITTLLIDMTVYANNQGDTENDTREFTQNTPNISTCSRYISMSESASVCYKVNAKNKNDVAKGFN
ncbi:hypothetical protein [Acinetobacter indicus]|uniref:hypothetical protein n=1 Tax=Acinetobacter indicus TaxID=756892 RepID=UPI0013157323|nr:hypothetical protein [Acinetobacter indicus]